MGPSESLSQLRAIVGIVILLPKVALQVIPPVVSAPDILPQYEAIASSFQPPAQVDVLPCMQFLVEEADFEEDITSSGDIHGE